jgi:hypothetical protein
MIRLYYSLIFWVISATAIAGVEVVVSNTELLLEDEILGVEVKLDNQGNMLSAVSSYSQVVDIPDRRGLNKAYLIAEEKAKAQLIRFINQDITTTRAIEQIEKSIENASRNSSSKEENWNKLNSREIKEIVTEISTSTARGVLKGLKVISKSYDEKKEEVTVVVGVNQKNLASAKAISDANHNSNKNQSQPKEFRSQSQEKLKSRDYDEYR